MARKKKDKKFIQKATERMEEKGTEGAFGKATDSKIKRGLEHGALEAKRANFARNMRNIARKHRHSGRR